MTEGNKFKLGLFVIAAIGLFVAAIFVFGLSEVFKTKVQVYSVFRESVQGLDVGAPVKYKGVRIGKVSRMDILGSEELIVVYMDIDLSVFRPEGQTRGQIDRYAFSTFINSQLKKGLTCGLELAGITGMKYVEFDFTKNGENTTPLPCPKDIDGIYIPSRQSMLQNLLKMINDSLANISSIKAGQLADELSSIFKRTTELLNSPKINNTIDQLERAAVNVNRTVDNVNSAMTKSRLDDMVKLLNEDLRNFNGMINQVRSEIEKSRIPRTTADIRQSLHAVIDTKNSVINTLQRLEQTLDTMNEFINTIDDDPSSMLRGKNKKPLTDADGVLKSRYLPEEKPGQPATPTAPAARK